MQRKKYIDLLRQIAIFYMFFFHVVLILLPEAEINGVMRVLFDIVPLDAALFLFLSGFSLTLSLCKHKDLPALQLAKNKVKRGLLLILAAGSLFLLQLGVQLPDMLICSGILNTIGWLCVIGGLLVMLPHQKIIISLLIAGLLVFTFGCEYYEIFFIPFNWGYEPMSPTIIFGLIGMLCGLFYNLSDHEKQKRNITIIIGAAGAALLIYFIWHNNILETLRDSRYLIKREFSTAATLPYLLSGGLADPGNFSAIVWNYRLPSFCLSLGIVCVLFSGFSFLEPFFKKYIPHAVFLPGAHALSSYFFHFVVIAVLAMVFGTKSFGLWTVLVILVLLYAGSYLLSLLVVFIKRKKRTAASS